MSATTHIFDSKPTWYNHLSAWVVHRFASFSVLNMTHNSLRLMLSVSTIDRSGGILLSSRVLKLQVHRRIPTFAFNTLAYKTCGLYTINQGLTVLGYILPCFTLFNLHPGLVISPGLSSFEILRYIFKPWVNILVCILTGQVWHLVSLQAILL